MSDEEDQADEVLALQSIYNGEEFSCVEAEDGLKSGKFHAFLSLPAGFHITFKTYSNGSPSSVVIPLEHLPPITLSFKLPKNYPSESSPEFELSCPWLTVTKLLKLCEKLEALWNEWKGSVILYTWTNFLKEESMDFIGVTDVLDITRRHLMELRRSGKLVDTKRNNNKRQRPLREAVARPPFDPRVVVPPPLYHFISFLSLTTTTDLKLRFLEIYTTAPSAFRKLREATAFNSILAATFIANSAWSSTSRRGSKTRWCPLCLALTKNVLLKPIPIKLKMLWVLFCSTSTTQCC
uniref:RWD domain-containing protein n=1 Tax=Lygus hesperus TaxID=30085 RepID=A0A0K8S7F3_LYGHE